MRILVTGGAGYIGTLLIPELLERGHKVTLLDNFTFGIQPLLHFITHPNLTIVSGDVRKDAILDEQVPEHDMIIHLAAIVGYPACAAYPLDAETINVGSTRKIMDRMSPNQSIMYASTGSTYGKVDGICDEETPINPLTLYGKTKWIAEQRVMEHTNAVSMRFATVFGIAPRLRLDLLVNDFVHQAIHNKQIILFEGHFRRTFLHARDAARVYTHAMDNWDAMKGEVFNVGDESMNFTKKELALEIQKQVPYYLHEADIGEDLDKRDYEVSYAKIKEHGYSATVGMEDGIAELVRSLRHLKYKNPFRNI
jgi:nucleoside-diphosphate-sugar epimerase